MIKQEEIQKRLIAAIQNGTKQKGDKKKLAQKIGIYHSVISAYLHNNKFPSLETFANLCVALDESADDILGVTEETNRLKNEK